MAHKAKWSDLAVSVGLVLAGAAACVSTPTARRAVQTFDVAAFLVAVNEAALGTGVLIHPPHQENND